MGISNSELQQMLIIISFCVLLTTFFKVVGSTQSGCRSEFKCSHDGPPIHFPFRLKDRHPDHCGCPGFVVSCNDRHETVLELPNTSVFKVSFIDYDDQQIVVNDSDNCLLERLSKIGNMSVSPFNLPYTNNITFLNCSVASTTSLDQYETVPCLSSPSHQIYAVDSSQSIEFILGCTKMYDVLSAPETWHWTGPSRTELEPGGKNCGLSKGT